MKPGQFNILAIAALVSLIAAGVVHSAYNNWNEETVSGERLFPSLASNGDAAGQIDIRQGKAKLTLKESADGKVWSIVERAGYPVDPQKVRELVVKLGQTELVERKTANKELWSQLELGDPMADGANAKLVRLADNANTTIAEVVVGKEKRAAFGAGKSGTYVRVPGNTQTWLAKLELNASTDVVDWVEPTIFGIDETKIKSLVVRDGDKVVYEVVPEGEKGAAFKLAGSAADAELKKDVRTADLVKGISTLEMLDVRAATTADAKPDMTADIKLADGANYQIGLKRDDKEAWLTIDVKSEGKDAAAAKKLGKATSGWAFRVADWRSRQTFKTADEMFEKVEAEAPKMSVPGQGASALGVGTPGGPAVAPEESPGSGGEPANADVPKP